MQLSLLLALVAAVRVCLCLADVKQQVTPAQPDALSAKAAASRFTQANAQVPLPDKVIVGYANWNECDSKLVDAVVDGVNVLIWFAINLAVNTTTGLPEVTGGPDMDCVADIMAEIDRLGLGNSTVHLISIGGWDAPHPDTSNNASMVYAQWDHWNRHVAARPEKGFYGFDGFDWDIEGNDDPASPYNTFTVQCLDLMGQFSQLAHWTGGYIVTMAPAESYLDPTRAPLFSRTVLHEYAEWQVGPSALDPPFRYHGLNVYSYLIARYDSLDAAADRQSLEELHLDVLRIRNSGVFGEGCADASAPLAAFDRRRDPSADETFSFVTVQLYEGYSHAEFNTTQLHPRQPPEEHIANFVRSVTAGFVIDFSTDDELGFPVAKEILIGPSRLVVGLANGWAGDGKFPLFYPAQVGRAYAMLLQEGEEGGLSGSNEGTAGTDAAAAAPQVATPRGFAFWDIADEGKASPQRPQEPVWMAAGLNRFMHTRQMQTRRAA